MTERISDERLAELVDIRAALHKDYDTPTLGEISDMATELAEFREREAATEYGLRWEDGTVWEGYESLQQTEEDWRFGSTVVQREAAYGPWVEVTDDE